MSSFSTSILKVVVGEEPLQKTFLVHEAIICERSEFFRRAMNGNWVESSERMVKLPEDSAEIFGTYINMVYTGMVATQLDDITDEKLKRTNLSVECNYLCRLYVLAEKLQDALAKDSVREALRRLDLEKSGGLYTLPPLEAINLLYEGTCEGDPVRSIFINRCLTASPEQVKNFVSKTPQEFVAELTVAAFTKWRGLPLS